MNLKFKNGKFTLLQVSDPQDLQFVRPTMVRMLNIAYDRVKPDLVVLTGDNILGNHLCDARFGSRIVLDTKEKEFGAMKKAIDNVVAPIEKRNIPFAMIYGNHDDRNRHTKTSRRIFTAHIKTASDLTTPLRPIATHIIFRFIRRTARKYAITSICLIPLGTTANRISALSA